MAGPSRAVLQKTKSSTGPGTEGRTAPPTLSTPTPPTTASKASKWLGTLPATVPTAPAKPGQVLLGSKRTCPKCHTRFYDFAKQEVNCPKCHTKVETASFLDALRSQEKKAPPKPPPKVIVESDEEGSAPEPTLEDIAGDDDDVAEDIPVHDEKDEDY